MKTLTDYLNHYSESHRHPTNIKIHNICVPAIYISVVALLAQVQIFGKYNFISAVIAMSALYYHFKFKNLNLFLISIFAPCVIAAASLYVPYATFVFGGIFVAAWIGQFYGHKIEGKKPSFFEDLQYFLIGPVWVLHKWKPNLLGVENEKK
jgi:uncharacterized membrane protein YGL010W